MDSWVVILSCQTVQTVSQMVGQTVKPNGRSKRSVGQGVHNRSWPTVAIPIHTDWFGLFTGDIHSKTDLAHSQTELIGHFQTDLAHSQTNLGSQTDLAHSQAINSIHKVIWRSQTNQYIRVSPSWNSVMCAIYQSRFGDQAFHSWFGD